jgi:L-alanine-DL-glutamate epimerase-like enolase superfamily enzyme
MKIAGATIYALQIPFVESFSHSAKSRQCSDSFVVRMRLEDGSVGFGEGIARPYVTGETVATSIDHIKESLWPVIAENDYAEILPSPDPLATFAPLTRGLSNRESNGVIAWHAAQCAVELALIDCLLHRQKMSLTQVLPPKRDSVVYSGVISAGPIEKARQHARHFKLFGIQQVKIKIGDPDSVARVGAVRQILGPQASLRVDANGAYDVVQAVAVIGELARFNLDAVEQPISRGKAEELARVKAQSTIPIVADESLVTLSDARSLISARACDYFNLRLSKCGGIVRTLKMAQLAKSAKVRVQFGSQVGETAVLSAAGRHLAAYLENVRFIEGSYGSLLLTEDVGSDSINFGHEGRARTLSGCGLGVKVREDILEKYALEIIPLGQG